MPRPDSARQCRCRPRPRRCPSRNKCFAARWRNALSHRVQQRKTVSPSRRRRGHSMALAMSTDSARLAKCSAFRMSAMFICAWRDRQWRRDPGMPLHGFDKGMIAVSVLAQNIRCQTFQNTHDGKRGRPLGGRRRRQQLVGRDNPAGSHPFPRSACWLDHGPSGATPIRRDLWQSSGQAGLRKIPGPLA